MTVVPLEDPRPLVNVTIDGRGVAAIADSTILETCRREGIDVPTLCYLESLTPVNTCRVCVVEVEGSRTLVPACSREVSEGLEVATDSERVGRNRKLVYELLVSSVDMSLVDEPTLAWMEHYEVDPERFGVEAATVEQPVKIEDDLYVRDYTKCMLCYKCVEACGEDAQNTFAISAAGRGFDAVISTEFDVVLPE